MLGAVVYYDKLIAGAWSVMTAVASPGLGTSKDSCSAARAWFIPCAVCLRQRVLISEPESLACRIGQVH